MDTLIWASSHPFWVLGLFFAALASFHYLFIVCMPLTSAGWKLTEYFWVALALVSVLGIVEQARSFRATLQGAEAWGQMEKSLGRLDNWVATYVLYACEDKADDPGFAGLCAWSRGKQAALGLIEDNEDFPFDIPANLLDGADSLGAVLTTSDLRPAVVDLAAYVSARQTYIDCQAAIRRSTLSRLSIGLAPFLLAIALALRMTKVTGEYRLARRRD